MADDIKKIQVRNTFKSALHYFKANQKIMILFWLANAVLLGIFSLISGGFANPLSIVWLMLYYFYWCGFFRVYFKKKPYFLTMDIFGSIVPSTKIFFITIFFAFLLVLIPFLPLFMGFNDKYLVYFEAYMDALENVEANILNQMVFSAVLLMVSPQIICRPFFAWIASLQGLNGSLRKAFRRTEGNYWNFILIMLILNAPCFIIYELDLYLGCHGWLTGSFCSVFFLYLNLVFAKLYDFFYNDETF